MKQPYLSQGGFTLVELITVMVIIGVLGAVGAARYVDRATFDAVAYTDQMRAVIRYGQKLAVAQNRPVHVSLNGNRVALCYAAQANCVLASRVPAASGSNSDSTGTVAQCGADRSWACEGNPSGIGYTASAQAALFYFDALGKPFYNFTTTPVAATSIVVTITGDDSPHVVTVEAETGYVH